MKNRGLGDSFKNACIGIRQAFITERNIKIHCIIAVLACLLAGILKFSKYEWIVIILVIIIVIVTEMLNTAVEYSIDMVCGNKYSDIAKYAKDIAAGATLISALGAVLVAVILYIPKILDLLKLYLL